jgi:ribosomal protein S18 acetylase RimI-like enzyme
MTANKIIEVTKFKEVVEYNIEILDQKDCEKCGELIQFITDNITPQHVAEVHKLEISPQSTYLLACDQKRNIIGCVILWFENLDPNSPVTRNCGFSTLIVEPSFRNIGIGKKLCQEGIRIAKQKAMKINEDSPDLKINKLILKVWVLIPKLTLTNFLKIDGLIKFYEKLGFRFSATPTKQVVRFLKTQHDSRYQDLMQDIENSVEYKFANWELQCRKKIFEFLSHTFGYQVDPDNRLKNIFGRKSTNPFEKMYELREIYGDYTGYINNEEVKNRGSDILDSLKYLNSCLRYLNFFLIWLESYIDISRYASFNYNNYKNNE